MTPAQRSATLNDVQREIDSAENQRAMHESRAAQEIASALRCTEHIRRLKTELFKLTQDEHNRG
jgi:hypothetical protein